MVDCLEKDLFNFDDNELFNFDDLDEENALEPREALRLIGRLYKLPQKNLSPPLKRVLYMLETELPNLLGSISISDNQLKATYNKLHTLAAKTIEQYRLPELSGKTVVGVGGMFSAGKSSFLNAMTGIELLPDNQQKCTAVATYMVSGKRSAITAYTMQDQAIKLSESELQAISHQFYDSYSIGFSTTIRKMVMSLPAFKWLDIVLLDTPGYNSELSEDDDLKNLVSDEKIARNHLSNCDYLIWLVDVESGIIPVGDIEFIKTLSLINKPLFVLNKADKKDATDLQSILETCNKQLDDENIEHAGVTAFSSRDYGGQEYLQNNFLQTYFEEATDYASKNKHSNVSTEITLLLKEWREIMESQKQSYDAQKKSIENGILNSENPRNITSLLNSYKLILQKSTNLFRQTQSLEKLGNELLSGLSSLR
ncbi:MAG: dynamin family protein [Vibrio sp.]